MAVGTQEGISEWRLSKGCGLGASQNQPGGRQNPHCYKPVGCPEDLGHSKPLDVPHGVREGLGLMASGIWHLLVFKESEDPCGPSWGSVAV